MSENTDLDQECKKAIIRRDMDTVRRCLNEGLNPNAMTDGRTLLMWAAWGNMKEAVELLIDLDADLDAQDKNGFTALMWACFNQDDYCVRPLVEAGANVEIMDNDRRMAVDHARRDQQASLVAYLEPLNAEFSKAARERRKLEKSIASLDSVSPSMEF